MTVTRRLEVGDVVEWDGSVLGARLTGTVTKISGGPRHPWVHVKSANGGPTRQVYVADLSIVVGAGASPQGAADPHEATVEQARPAGSSS